MQEDKNIEEYVSFDESDLEQKPDFWLKLKTFLEGRYFLPIIIILVAISAFALGRVTVENANREPVRVISNNPSYIKEGTESKTPVLNPNNSANLNSATISNSLDATEQVVASKSGTKYHYPWCAGAKQISEKNKITFNSIAEARAKGYTPASNCKGLK
jgi:hypothetical protein